MIPNWATMVRYFRVYRALTQLLIGGSVNVYMDTLLLLGPNDMSKRVRAVLKMLAVDPDATETPVTVEERDALLMEKWGTTE